MIPVTNFYNELMLHKNIRDPKVALNTKLMFTDLSNFSDSDLTYAFLTYNTIKTKVQMEGSIAVDRKEKPRFVDTLRNIFSKK